MSVLQEIHKKMVPGGKIILEVPHAKDALIQTFQNKPFMQFSFWSEHLLLHTRQTLQAFLEAAGFSDVIITGYQRYPLANHLFWLSQMKPGGHVEWNHFVSNDLDSAYSSVLARLDQTDTLIAVASKPFSA